MEIVPLLAEMVRLGASDVHLIPHEPPVLRINGEIYRLSGAPLGGDRIREFLAACLSAEQYAALTKGVECDSALEVPDVGRFRLNAFNHLEGVSVACRYIATRIPTLGELELPEVVSRVAGMARGLVLVTGPTGSGKSTTLAAMLASINTSRAAHIVTIEDPIEYVHASARSVIHQREVRIHTHSFSTALRAALREDPDVLLIGELRDRETIQLALTAAETGHLVMASVHAASASKTIDRIIDVFPAAQQLQVRSMLSESLRMVIAQTLCARRAGGRVAAMEILVATPAIRTLIREGKTHQIVGAMQAAKQVGMQTLAMHLRALVCQGVITPECEAATLLGIDAV